MFSTDDVEALWKQMSGYERDHFGLKFGDDFNLVAQALRASERFMRTGGLALMLSSLDMMSVRDEMEKATNRESVANSIMQKPNTLHNVMAEVFYLGYRIGKKESETAQLEKLGAA